MGAPANRLGSGLIVVFTAENAAEARADIAAEALQRPPWDDRPVF